MSHYTATQLAEIRRQELTQAATYHPPARTHPTRRRKDSGSPLRKPITAFHSWLAAGQL